MLTETQALAVTPLLPTAILLLATGSSWRARRAWAESVGLGAGVLLLTLVLGWLPAVVFTALLPTASILMSLLVLAWCEWRFAPDIGQSGFAWALAAAVRPALGSALGAAAGFGPMLLFPGHRFLPPACALAVLAGLLTAHAFDRAFLHSPIIPPRFPPDEDGGSRRHEPELTLS